MARHDSRERLVWYVGFGSNLLRERLLAYLAGAPDGSEFGPQAGTSDPAPPRDDLVVDLPHRLYFGSHSRSWDGAVAFVDPVVAAQASVGRAYLVTSSQLADICAQENRWPGPVDLPDAGSTTVGHGTIVCEGLYRLLVRLEDIGGHEAFTLTSDTLQPAGPAGVEYIAVVRRGLLECGLHPAEVDRYLGVHGAH